VGTEGWVGRDGMDEVGEWAGWEGRVGGGGWDEGDQAQCYL
jgi:hypothetical protein